MKVILSDQEVKEAIRGYIESNLDTSIHVDDLMIQVTDEKGNLVRNIKMINVETEIDI